MKRYSTDGSISLLAILLLISVLRAADIDKQKTKSLAKPTRTIDLSVGLLDAGKIQHAVFNDGLLSTWNYREKVPAVFYKGWSYIPDLTMMVGVPEDPAWTPYTTDLQTGLPKLKGPSVSEKFANNDWGPKAGSFGKLHSGDMIFGNVLSGTTLQDYPLMATSSYPASWPKNDNGYPFWPGMWALDPKTGVVMWDSIAATQFDFNNPTRPWMLCPTSADTVLVGKFFSDKEVFFSITDYELNNQNQFYAESDGDSTQGYRLGIQLDISALAYGRSYAEDIIFFPMKIINNSPYNYHDVYIGFYNDSDVPEYNLTGTLNDRMDWMTYIASEYDAENDTTYHYNMAYIYDYRYGTGNFPGPEYKVIPALKILETPPAPKDIDMDGDGVVDIFKGEQLGITGWHWFEWEQRPGQIDNTRLERMTYQLIAGDTTNLLPEEQEAYFWPDPDGKLNPHFDSPKGFREMYPEGMDCVFIMSSGPFDLPAGSSTTFSFALVVGDDTNDVKFNARTAQFMYELRYQGADPPPTPTLWAVPGDGRVTLYWDDKAEAAVDLMTGYHDFEGYKLYRTTADPVNNQWGEKIYDGYGLEVGFVPLAQFDLNNSIANLDPVYPHLNLGQNTGLVHSYVDSNLINGQTYWYSLTAYDRGVRSDPVLNPDNWAPLNYLETAKGLNPSASPNLVMVVPGKTPSNYVESDIKVEPLPGAYDKHIFKVKIVDPYAITGHSYLISFDDTSGSKTTFSLFDEIAQKFLIKDSPNLSGQVSPIMDGMTLAITQRFSKVDFDPDSIEWYHGTFGTPTRCNWKFSGTYLAKDAYDYEIRFTDEPDTAFFPATLIVPFEIWNLTLNQKAKFAQYPPPNPADTTQEMKNTWTSGDVFKVQEKIGGKTMFTFTFSLSAPPLKVTIVKIDTVEVAPSVFRYDTTFMKTDTSVAPVTGDAVRLIPGKPFKGSRDFFRLNTATYTSRPVTKEDLDKVKVVPNPYIVSAEWELDPNKKQLAFTNLPTVCDIHIFTLSGERVAKLHHESATQGWEWWDLLSVNQQETAYGCYVYVIETPSGQKKVGKFVVLR
ncbi:MAG: hypothetical protein ONB16_00515 [candidate division KSB1 bacterium]|nr:hypothetical protein [candidate division KSB1 bacterium]MDZ7317714.1 hypothetical protein [candidate division KSB1 bacterium]MDZ7341855.1 hypothetical protein [candidate division KSB1 bacterium]